MCKRSGTLCRWLYRSLFTWMDALRHPDLRLAQSGQYRPHSGVGRALVKYTHVLRVGSVFTTVVMDNCVFVGNQHRNTMTDHVHQRYLRAC